MPAPLASPVASPLGYDGGLTLAMQVKDRKKAIAWYQDVLGLQLLYDVEEIGWCELSTEVKGVNIGLSQVESPAPGKGAGKGAVPTFGVKDIAKARAMME